MKRLIQELSVKCNHPLCEKIVKKAYLKKHEAQCEMALMKCTNSPACGEIVRKNLKKHLTEICPYRPTKCTLECGSIIAYLELDDHISKMCPNALLKCPQECGASLLRREIFSHFSQACPNESVSCPFCDYFGTVCGVQCLRKDLKEHQLTCNYREVRCGNSGCKERVMYQYLQDHEDSCKYKIILCYNGCEAVFLRKELEQHKNTCELEIVDCSYKIVGCLDRIIRKEFQQHLIKEAKNHEILMLKTYSKHNDMIKKLENQLHEFRSKTIEELNQIKALMKSQKNNFIEYNIDEEMPNPFSEILKQQ